MKDTIGPAAALLLCCAPLAAAQTVHLEGDVSAADGRYTLVTFDVPAGTEEIQIAHSDGSSDVILDWGVWSPSGFRGWGGGLTDDAIVGAVAASRGYLPGAIAAGTWTLVIGEAKLLAGAGHYSVDVTVRAAATLPPVARAAFTARVLETGARWYRGDFHVHSEESGDASATLDEIVTLARARGLDFVVLSDHNTVSQHGRQAALQAGVDDVLLVRGNEVTTYAGHGNAVGAAEYVDHRVGLGGVSAKTIIDAVVAQGGMFIVNHPTFAVGDLCIGCAWTHADTPWDEVSAIEIHNGNYTLSIAAFTPNAINLWELRVGEGHTIAAVGGSDDHDAGRGTGINASPIGSPTTLVFADELSEAGLVAAVRAGRTQVLLRGPDEPHLEVEIDEGRSAPPVTIGGTAQGITTIPLTVRAVGTVADASTLVLYRDNLRAGEAAITAAAPAHTFMLTARGGRERFRAELEVGTQRRVVTSHVHVDGVAPPAPDAGVPDAGAPDAPPAVPGADDDSGGCAVGARAGAGGGGVLPLLFGFALAGIRRRRAK